MISTIAPTTLRAWDVTIAGQLRSGDLRIYRSTANRFLSNQHSERLAQYHRNIPVYGADLLRQTRGGITTAVFGTLFTNIDIDIDTMAGLSPETARATFENLGGSLIDTPTLWILPTSDSSYALTYRGTLSNFRTLFIDAHSGKVLFEYSALREQTIGHGTGQLGDKRKISTDSSTGTYRARDRARPAELRTLDMNFDADRFMTRANGLFRGDAPTADQDLAVDTDNDWSDGAVVDTHTAMGWTVDYLYTHHDWNGIDGQNGAIDAFVHPLNATDIVDQFQQCAPDDSSDECELLEFLRSLVDNAAYVSPGNSNSTGFMIFGEPFFLDRPLTAVDVVAHEMAHGVTFFTARLGDTGPPNEPGALNEAFSDVIGTAVEFYVQPPGDDELNADYLLGEDIGLVVRSLSNPGEIIAPRLGPYPDHFSKLYRGSLNRGGIHFNATILGHAYYLAIEGGRNRTSGRSVTGVGSANRGQIERVFFNAWEHLLPRFANFRVAADCLIQSSIDLFGASHAATVALAEALDAVGIRDAQTCHDAGDCR
jgi:Zn-dependent metalloprotease